MVLTPLVLVAAGLYHPQFPVAKDDPDIPVRAFRIEQTPVTNAQFLAFVAANPKWLRGAVNPLFADTQYLSRWTAPLSPAPGVDLDAPVTHVSWFAAKAYCAAEGRRLPTIAEWERAAAASETRPDASKDPAFVAQILDWYSAPTPARLPPVAEGEPNYWGVYDMHGLVWEWTLDFNSDLVAGDGRDQDDPDKLQFCGTGALGARDSADYASFMRVAMRTSLKADYTTANLGFRCVAPSE